jgi:hypothetical protein
MAAQSVVEQLGLQLKPTRIKGSHYLLIPKDLADLLEINDRSILNLTIEDTDKGQRLIYSVSQDRSQVESQVQSISSRQNTTVSQ